MIEWITRSDWYRESKYWSERCGQNFSLNAIMSLALLATILVAVIVTSL